MSAAPEDHPPGYVSPESLRREADRQIVGLLKQNHEDNRQIIALLAQVVDLLRDSKSTPSCEVASPSCADTGFYPSIN